MKVIKDIPYGITGHPKHVLNLYLPDTDSFKVFLYMHGGGLENGNKGGGDAAAEYLAERGIATVAINYRLYPTARYPEFILDCAEAINWVHDHIGEYGNCEGLYIGGSSAGGYLSMMLCFDKRWLTPYKLPADFIKGYIHDAGQPTTHFNVLRERGVDPRKVVVDDAAPLYHIGEATEYPPMLFIVSDNDMANRYEQTQLVLSTMKHFGYDESKICYKLMHGTHCHYSYKPELGEIVYDFIKKF